MGGGRGGGGGGGCTWRLDLCGCNSADADSSFLLQLVHSNELVAEGRGCEPNQEMRPQATI